MHRRHRGNAARQGCLGLASAPPDKCEGISLVELPSGKPAGTVETIELRVAAPLKIVAGLGSKKFGFST